MKAKIREAKKKENGILIDWLEFTMFNCSSPDDVIDFLGLNDIQFEDSFPRYGYKYCMLSQHIQILYGGRDDMGVHCIMSGQGCRSFEQYSRTDTFDSILKKINDNINIRCSRLDVAYDDFNHLIDLNAIQEDIKNGLCVSRFKKGNIISSFDICNSIVRDTTINFGKQNSNTWITIYDKLAEQKSKDIMPDVDFWVRCELKMRHSNADRFIQLLSEDKPIDELYFLVLNNYVRFVKPADDTNKSRWPSADHWSKFCNSVVNDCISLFVAPDDSYSEYKLKHYVVGMAGAAVYTYIQRFGIKDFIEQIDYHKYKLNQKYLELLTIPEELPEDEE